MSRWKGSQTVVVLGTAMHLTPSCFCSEVTQSDVCSLRRDQIIKNCITMSLDSISEHTTHDASTIENQMRISATINIRQHNAAEKNSHLTQVCILLNAHHFHDPHMNVGKVVGQARTRDGPLLKTPDSMVDSSDKHHWLCNDNNH